MRAHACTQACGYRLHAHGCVAWACAGVLRYKRDTEVLLAGSGLPYTVVRPSRLTDGPYTSYDVSVWRATLRATLLWPAAWGKTIERGSRAAMGRLHHAAAQAATRRPACCSATPLRIAACFAHTHWALCVPYVPAAEHAAQGHSGPAAGRHAVTHRLAGRRSVARVHCRCCLGACMCCALPGVARPAADAWLVPMPAALRAAQLARPHEPQVLIAAVPGLHARRGRGAGVAEPRGREQGVCVVQHGGGGAGQRQRTVEAAVHARVRLKQTLRGASDSATGCNRSAVMRLGNAEAGDWRAPAGRLRKP